MKKILFPYITWWLLLLIPFVFFAFYPKYFSKLGDSIPSIIHIHTFFMSLWVTMAIVQPFLIKQKKTKLHKLIGRVSYFIMPIVFITVFFTLRNRYNTKSIEVTERVEKGTLNLRSEEIPGFVAESMAIAFTYFFLLMLFYLLAIINRKKILYHSTYMFAAILTILGPTLDRIFGRVYRYYGITDPNFYRTTVFLLIDLLLLGLLWYQWKKGNSPRAAAIALIIYITAQLAYFFVPQTGAWKSFVVSIMQ